MNLSEVDDINVLKALGYDAIRRFEEAEKYLNMVNNRIQQVEQQANMTKQIELDKAKKQAKASKKSK